MGLEAKIRNSPASVSGQDCVRGVATGLWAGQQTFMKWSWLGVSLCPSFVQSSSRISAWSLSLCHLVSPLLQKELHVLLRSLRLPVDPDTRRACYVGLLATTLVRFSFP